MDYSFASAAWSDCHSCFAFSWPDENRGGLQALHSLRTHGGLELTRTLLTWHLTGTAESPVFQTRHFAPEKVVEVSRSQTVEFITTLTWAERNTLHMEFCIRNLDTQPVSVQLEFCSEAQSTDFAGPGALGKRIACEQGRKTVYRKPLSPWFGETEGSWMCVMDFEPDPDPGIRDIHTVEGKLYPLYCLTDLRPKAFRLAPGEQIHESRVMALGSDALAVRKAYQGIPDSWQPSRATERMRKLLERAPDMDPDFAGDPGFERLYMQAVCGLNSLYIAGDGGLAGEDRIPWTCKHVLAGGFFWDTAFTSCGGVWMNPDAAKESISAFCRNPNYRGALPANLTDCALGGEGQFPILTWGAWNIFAATGDTDWLRQVLPSLRSHVEHWFRFFSRENGLCYIYNSYLGNDDDARFDYCMKGLYNQPVDAIDSPDINAVLQVELRALALMFEALGDPESAQSYRTRADRLGTLILERFYFPDRNAFLDTEEGTREIKSGVLTPHMFLPLWAECPLPKEAVSGIIETHMLDPEKFFGEYPFPSLAYNHPEYDPEGYWRGRVWPHMVFWMIQTLWLYDYREEATTVARRLLKMMLKTPWICENYNSQNGVGWNPDTNRGWPGYNWCYATVILLITGKHKQPPLPELRQMV